MTEGWIFEFVSVENWTLLETIANKWTLVAKNFWFRIFIERKIISDCKFFFKPNIINKLILIIFSNQSQLMVALPQFEIRKLIVGSEPGTNMRKIDNEKLLSVVWMGIFFFLLFRKVKVTVGKITRLLIYFLCNFIIIVGWYLGGLKNCVHNVFYCFFVCISTLLTHK